MLSRCAGKRAGRFAPHVFPIDSLPVDPDPSFDLEHFQGLGMKLFPKVVFSVDCQSIDEELVKKAIRITSQLECELTILDSIHELSWLTKLTLPNHESITELVERDKNNSIQEMVDRFCRSGIPTTGELMHGPTSSNVVDFCEAQGTDLILRVTRGAQSNEPGRLGRTSKRLLRKSPCPIWLMHPHTRPLSENVVACIDTEENSEEDFQFADRILETAKYVGSKGHGLVSIVHAWNLWNEKMVKHRISESEFETWKLDCRESEAERLNQFLSRHEKSCEDHDVFLVEGDPSIAIPEFVKDVSADVVVMGTVGRSGFTGMLVGNTAERIFERVPCDVLALKPKLSE